MPISGRLEADFASFYDACQRAELSLRGFDAGAGRVEQALNKMVDSFTGRKIISDATLMAEAVERIGGTSKLTTAELARMGAVASEAIAKLRAVGGDIPAGLQRIADAADRATKSGSMLGSTFGQVFAGFTAANLITRAAGALTSMATEALATAGALVDMSNKTGLSTETLQRMSFVAKQSGTDVAAFSDAAFQLGVHVTEGTGKARRGAEDLGLSWQKLRASAPDDRFNMVVQALEAMENPQKRNTAAVELFGKSAAPILAAIADGYTKVAGEASVAGDAQVRALDATGDAWDRFKDRTQNAFIQAAGSVVLLHDAVNTLTAEQRQFILDTDKSIKTTDDFSAALIRAAAARGKMGKDVNLPAETAAQKSFTDELKATEAAYQALTTEERANIKAALEIGKSNDDIVNTLNITDATLALVKKAWQEEATAATQALAQEKKDLDERNRKFEQGVEYDTKLIADYFARRVKESGTANDQERAKIRETEEFEIASLRRRGLATDERLALLKSHTKQALNEVGVDWDLLATHSIAAQQETADNALKTYNAMVAHGGFFREELQRQLEKYRELAFAATASGQAEIAAEDSATAATQRHTAALQQKKQATATSMGMGSLFGDQGSNEKTVRTLSGEMLTPAEAKARFDMGGSFNVDTSTEAGRAQIPPDIKQWYDAGWSIEQAVRLATLMRNAGQGGLGAIGRDPLLAMGPQGGYRGGGGGNAAPTPILPALSPLVPLSAGGSTTVVVHMNVSGVFDANSKRALAAAVSDELLTRVKMGRQFGTA